MSVYRPKDKNGKPRSPNYLFDFTITVDGEPRRFYGSTGQRTFKAAKEYETRERERVASEGPNDRMILVEAVHRYAEEVLAGKPSLDDTANGLKHCTRLIGGNKLVSRIVSDDIADAVRRRSAERVGKPPPEGKEDWRRLVTPATVNRNIVEPMRALLNYAQTVWGVACQPHLIKWDRIRRKEPKGRDRELRPEEAEAFWKALRTDFHPFTAFQFARGIRLAAALALKKTDVDLARRRVRVHIKKKGLTWLPISRADAELLRGQMALSPLPCVWTYEARRAPKKGMRFALKLSGYRRSFETAVRRAGISDFRRHDMRHDFATKLLRATRDLALVKEAMVHSDIASTIRYAHVLDEDVAAGLEALAEQSSRNSTEVGRETDTEIETRN